MSSEHARGHGLRLLVFAAALIPRLAIAWITFGAVEAVHGFRQFVRLIHHEWMVTPYLPFVELPIWISGVATYFTTLPATFPQKLLGVVCDALIALVLFDAAPDRRSGLRAGLLYAAAVTPLFTAAIHPQWDSAALYALLLALVLLRRKTTGGAAAAAVAVVVSVVVKPIAVPLVLFLLPRDRRRATAFLGAGAAAFVVYLAILYAVDWMPDLSTLKGIVQYAGGGVQIIGLPYRPHNRLVAVIGALAVISFAYFRCKCTREEAVLLFFAITLGLSGLFPTYLCWIVPFAVLCGRTRFLALYGVAAGVFVVFYYQTPYINTNNVDNLGAYGLLRSLGRFGPPLPPPSVQPLLQILGNFAIPLLLVAFAAWTIITMLNRSRVVDAPREPATLAPYAGPAIAAAVLLGAATIWAVLQPPIQDAAFIVRMDEKVAAYDVVRYRGPLIGTAGTKVWLARSLLEPGVGNRVLNISTFFLAWVGISSLAAALWRIPGESR